VERTRHEHPHDGELQGLEICCGKRTGLTYGENVEGASDAADSISRLAMSA
jgi:hypothetical protein